MTMSASDKDKEIMAGSQVSPDIALKLQQAARRPYANFAQEHFGNSESGNSGRTHVWLDCDPGHDDAIAILLTVHLPNVALLGISTSSCNASVEDTANNAALMLAAVGAPPQTVFSSPLLVHTGCKKPLVRLPRHAPDIHGADGLGGVEGLHELSDPIVQRFLQKPSGPARTVHAIRDAALLCRSHGQDMTILITGAHTNIALFLTMYPELVGEGKGVKSIVFMGGGVGLGNTTAAAEFNIICDPEAAAIVVNAPCPVFMVPLNITHQAIWHSRLQFILLDPAKGATGTEPSEIKASTPLRHTLSTIFDFFAQQYRKVFNFTNGPPIHDALCVLFVSKPSIFGSDRFRVEVECSKGYGEGMTVVDIEHARDGKFRESPHSWDHAGLNVIVVDSIQLREAWMTVFEAVDEADRTSPLNKGMTFGSRITLHSNLF